ncbi:MAG: class A beta-lactamase-related serine hydrolase [Chloroflexi bacterium]|nr:class A beta-lactamase-related serine hydrolase [Chloroflexota bacterium]
MAKAKKIDSQALRRRVQGIIRRFSGRVGVAARNLTTGEELYIREHEQFPTLSTIRVPMMTELFFQAHEGKVRLDEKVVIKKSDHRGGTGVLKELSAPLEMTLRDICIFTIKESDNTASWLEVQRLGKDNINKRMRSLGLNEVELRSDLSASMFTDIQNTDISSVAVASPANLMELVSGMAKGTLVSKKASAEMLDILHRCNEPEFMGRYLPIDQLPEDTNAKVEAKLSNKTGSFLDGRTDVGLVETERVSFVLAVMTAECKDPGYLLFQHEGARTIGRISQGIYNAWVHGK